MRHMQLQSHNLSSMKRQIRSGLLTRLWLSWLQAYLIVLSIIMAAVFCIHSYSYPPSTELIYSCVYVWHDMCTVLLFDVYRVEKMTRRSRLRHETVRLRYYTYYCSVPWFACLVSWLFVCCDYLVENVAQHGT